MSIPAEFDAWQSQYGLGDETVPALDDLPPLLAFLVKTVNDPEWFGGSIREVIQKTIEPVGQHKLRRYAVLYCLMTEIANDSRSAREVQAALDDLRVIFRLGPAAAKLVTLLWDMDDMGRSSLTFGFLEHSDTERDLRLLAMLPREGRVVALCHLMETDRISQSDAQRFLFELLPFSNGGDEEVLLSVRVHVFAGDVFRALRCIEKAGAEGYEAVLDVLAQAPEMGKLAGMPWKPGTIAYLSRVSPLFSALRATSDN
jgi:hypothetical protein